MDSAAIRSAFFIEEIPSIPFAFASSLSCATVMPAKSFAAAFGAAFFGAAFLGAAFFAAGAGLAAVLGAAGSAAFCAFEPLA